MQVRAWVRLGVPSLITAAAGLLNHYTTDGADDSLYTRLYYVPVTLGALSAGWRGGLLSGSVAVFALLWNAADLSNTLLLTRCIEAVCLLGVAVLTGFYTDKQRRRKEKYQDVASKLSEVYESLQVNFEGMKRAERLSAIGHLSAGLAHEIRNPLASIAGAASILRRTVSTDPKVIRCVDIIEGECKRLNGLLTNFLNFARPRSPQFQSVDLNVLLAEVMELAEHAVNRRQIRFRTDIRDDLTHVDCDPEQLRQVLLNLLINAVEASTEETTVILSAGLEEGAIVIRVIDEGSGVTPEDIDKLFDPFFTTKETGTGLGLPVAHQIIGQMGGSLSARRNPLRGMTFSVILPLTRRTAA